MATNVRIGLIVGAVAFVLLYALQSNLALGIVPWVTVTGAIAGLLVAKWLDRAWYGRQLEAGAKTGAIASGMAAAGALLSLIVLGPHSVAALAAHSYEPGYSLARVIRSVAFLGWIGVDIAFVSASLVGGILVAAVLAQVAAWSKSVRVTRSITQARLAAQELNREEGWRAVTGSPVIGQPVPASALLAQLRGASFGGSPVSGAHPAIGLATPLSFAPNSSPGMPTATPIPPHAGPSAQPASPPSQPGAETAQRPRAAAKRIDRASTEEIRAALAAWEEDNATPPETSDTQEHATTTHDEKPVKRTAVTSAYLNSAPPTPPKRNRKKQATRDWLC